ncbi:MAG TPA: DUF4157 domain-containing protein [Polyangiaceae bacterium]
MSTFASLQRRQPLRTRQQQEKTKATVAVKKRSVGPVPNAVNWALWARSATAQSASNTVALSSPGDAAEREADQLASRVTRLTTANVDVTSTNSHGSAGHSLARDFGTNMGRQLGCDLDGVRVHHDDAATELARAFGARAVTRENHIYFDRSEYQPGSQQGRQLLAHELVHVVQQHGGSTITAGPLAGSAISAVNQPIAQRQVTSALSHGWQMYSGMTDEGAEFARRLMRWRVLGLGADYRTTGQDDWSAFMAARPEIHRATLDLFESLVPQFASGGPTGSEWSGGWKAFKSVMTGVRLNELESMRLTLHGCHRIDVRGRYWVGEENGVKTVKIYADFDWIDRADLHPGTATELAGGQLVDDREFTAAGFDYDISIRFEIPGSIGHSPISTWTIEAGQVKHVRGWPPEARVPAAGFRG